MSESSSTTSSSVGVRRRDSTQVHMTPVSLVASGTPSSTKRKRVMLTLHTSSKRNKVTRDYSESHSKVRSAGFRISRLVKKTSAAVGGDAASMRRGRAAKSVRGKGVLGEFKTPHLISNMEKLRQLCVQKSRRESGLFTEVELRSLSKYNPCYVEDLSSSLKDRFPVLNLLKQQSKKLVYVHPDKDDSKIRYLEASAVSSLRNTGSDIRPALVIMLYQDGFSLNGSNYRPYDTTGKKFLECIDQGYIPTMISELFESSSVRLQHYDGGLLVEIQDFRAASFASPIPEKKLMFLQPGNDYISYNVNLIADKLYRNIDKKLFSLQTIDDLKIEIEKQLLNTKNLSVCTSPSLAVHQIGCLVNYNKKKDFVKPVSDKIVYSKKLLQLSTDEINNLKIGSSNSKSVKYSLSDTKHLDPSILNRAKTLLELSQDELNYKSARNAATQNAILNDPLFRNTIFNRNASLKNQAHLHTLFVSKSLQQGNGRDSRITIVSPFRQKPPSQRKIPNVQSSTTPQGYRFASSNRNQNPAQYHDIFIVPRTVRLSLPSSNGPSAIPEIPKGTYEAIIKISQSGDNSRSAEQIRVSLGNKDYCDRFIKMYEKQSEKEGRKLKEQSDQNLMGKHKESKYLNFISLDPAQSEITSLSAQAATNAYMNSAAARSTPRSGSGGSFSSPQDAYPKVQQQQPQSSSIPPLEPSPLQQQQQQQQQRYAQQQQQQLLQRVPSGNQNLPALTLPSLQQQQQQQQAIPSNTATTTAASGMNLTPQQVAMLQQQQQQQQQQQIQLLQQRQQSQQQQQHHRGIASITGNLNEAALRNLLKDNKN